MNEIAKKYWKFVKFSQDGIATFSIQITERMTTNYALHLGHIIAVVMPPLPPEMRKSSVNMNKVCTRNCNQNSIDRSMQSVWISQCSVANVVAQMQTYSHSDSLALANTKSIFSLWQWRMEWHWAPSVHRPSSGIFLEWTKQKSGIWRVGDFYF